MKKVLSLVLALAMVLALAVPAFATTNDVSEGGGSVKASGSVEGPTVSVDLPANTTFVVNPYGLEVGDDSSTDPIISTPMYLENKSDTDINVSMTVKGEASTGVTFATAATTGGTKPVTTKSVFLYADIQATDDGTTAPAVTGDGKAANQAIVAAKDTVKANVLQLKKTGSANKTFACVQLKGDAAPAPTTPWADSDTVDVTFTFTFSATTITTAS